MTFLSTAVAFLIAIVILIVVHELGHYWVARLCGVKVLRFSVGMGRVVWSRRVGPDQTEWAISALPFGGYVKMLDAREQDPASIAPADLSREFTRQSVWCRIAIVAAGPIANFLLAIVVFGGLYAYGMPEPGTQLRAPEVGTVAYDAGIRGGERIRAIDSAAVDTWGQVRWQIMQGILDKRAVQLDLVPREDAQGDKTVLLPLGGAGVADLEKDFLSALGLQLARPDAQLGRVMEGGPAERAGFQSGDRVLSIDGSAVIDGLDFIQRVRAGYERELVIEISRNGERQQIVVTPETHDDNGVKIGRLRVEVPLAPEMVQVKSGPVEAMVKGVQRTWNASVLTLKMLAKMVVGEVSWKHISGPITIADYAGQTARIGLVSYLSFLAFISISLGVMNLLPIPVLDGGHLLYYSLELLTGRPVSERFGLIAQRAGVGVLMTLMAVAVFNDVVRLIS